MFKIEKGRSWLFKVPFVKDVLEQALYERLSRLKSAQERIERNRREVAHREEASFFLNQPVLVLSNEWRQPMVGVLVAVDEVEHASGYKSFLPVVEEAFSKERFACFGIIRPLTIPTLKAVDKLDPNECWMLVNRYGSRILRPRDANAPTMTLYDRVKNETDYFERFKLEECEIGVSSEEESDER